MLGDILVNRFRLEERLGGGAQGEIYRARDLELSRSVAVKIPNEKVDENFVNTFKREAKLLVKFEHANVVTLHDYYDPPGGMPFLVMEYLQGQPLDVRLKDKERPLTRQQLRNFAEQICGALQKAHEAGLVHRDIKPSNVMLVDEGKKSERFVMLDLGIAKLADFATITNPTIMGTQGEFSGTIAYMSPEQLEGAKVDFRSDIYSFGTTMYQILTGQLPFAPPDSYAGLFGFMQKVVKENPPAMSEVAPDQEFSPQLEEVVQDCMAKEAGDRPDSMQTVSQRLLKSLPSDIASAVADTQIISQDTIRNWEATLPRSSAKSYLGWVTAALVLILGGLWFAYGNHSSQDKSPQALPPTPPEIAVDTKTLRIAAGDSATLQILLTSDVDGFANLNLKGIPGVSWNEKADGETLQKQVHVRADEIESVEIQATATLEATPRDAETLTTVEIEDPETGKQLTHEIRAALIVQQPQVWLPDAEGFRRDPESGLFPHPHNKNAGPGYKKYLPGRIERLIVGESGAEIRIPFLLIHRARLPGSAEVDSQWPRDAEPFYLMENKVRNQWVLEYAAAHPGAFDLKSWTYHGENSQIRPTDGLFDWLIHPEKPEYLNIPAMNLRVDEAELIAQWIGNGHGTLPRQNDWNIATGLWDQDVEFVKKNWPQGPYHGVWDAAVPLRIALNRKPGTEPPAVVGSSADDVSPYGCRDMAGNGWEYTAEVNLDGNPEGTVRENLALIQGQDTSASVDLEDSWTVSRGQQYFRGGSANSKPVQPLTYNDLSTKDSEDLIVALRGRDVGFRVMIPID